MRRLAFAIALACALSGAVRAGEVPSTGATAPQPSSPVVTAGQIHTTGEIHSTGGEVPSTGATAPEASNSVLTIILTLLGIVP
jgi:hypothetical protein